MSLVGWFALEVEFFEVPTCKADKDIFKCSYLNQRPKNILLSKMFVADCIEKQKMSENRAQLATFLQELPWLITKGKSSAFER